MEAQIYVPAVSLKPLEPSYQCTLHFISLTVLAHITTVHQMLNWPSVSTGREHCGLGFIHQTVS